MAAKAARSALDLAREAAQLLNDAEPGFEHVRWSRAELVEFVSDACGQIALLRPELFSRSEVLTLAPGARQVLPEGAGRLYRVEGALDAQGRIVGEPVRMDARAARVAQAWFADLACACAGCGGGCGGGYVLHAFRFDPQDPSVFYVEPPVPAGRPVRVGVTLARTPDVLAEGDALPLDGRFHNAVLEWVLFRAFSKDLESASSGQSAAVHLKHFYEMLGLSAQADGRYGRQSMNMEQGDARSD